MQLQVLNNCNIYQLNMVKKLGYPKSIGTTSCGLKISFKKMKIIVDFRMPL